MRKKIGVRTSLAPLAFGSFRLLFGSLAFGSVRLGFGESLFFGGNEGETDSDASAAAAAAGDCAAADLLRRQTSSAHLTASQRAPQKER